jgi:phthiocerol/phenolphthiocerol synthesis type-I polyketide synthase C
MGLAATSVSWGAIDDAGFLARNKKIKEALQSRMGGSAINSALALEKLENLLTTDRSGLGIVELDWRVLSRFLPNSQTPKFSEIASKYEGTTNENDSVDTFDLLLDELSDDELSALLIKMLKSELSEILRISPDKIDATRSLNTMGLDSLMGVELSVAVEARFGIRLPVMALRDNATLTKLSHTIIAHLKRHGDAETAVDSGNNLNQIEQLATQHGLDSNFQAAQNLPYEFYQLNNRIID